MDTNATPEWKKRIENLNKSLAKKLDWRKTAIGGYRDVYTDPKTRRTDTIFVSPSARNAGSWHATSQIGGPNGVRENLIEGAESAEQAMKMIDEACLGDGGGI